MVEHRQINLRLSEDLLARIEEVRGDVPRNTWVIRAVELRLDFRNVSSDAIDRLIADWRAASEMRQYEGAFDDIDREIALRTTSREGASDGA